MDEPQQMKPQQITATIFNVISILFSTIVVLSYWKKKPIHSFPLDIAILLCFSCVFVHLFNTLVLYFPLILIITSILLFFNVLCCCLTCIMSFTLLFNFGRVNYVENNKKMFIIIYSSISIGIGLIISTLHFILENFSNKKQGSMMDGALYSYLAVIWTSMALNCVFLVITAVKIKTEFGFDEYRVKLVFYALTPIIFYIPETVNSIMSNKAITGPPWFAYLVLVTMGIKGVVFTIVFGMNLNIVAGFKNIFMEGSDGGDINNIDPLMKTIIDESYASQSIMVDNV